MDEFSSIFELFALLLGLAVAEMLGGFGQVLKLRARRMAGLTHAHAVRVGWLVPLLGLMVLVDLATFWSNVWLGRDTLHMNMMTVFCVLALIGGYYLVATQVFPDKPQDWPDFDDWYKLTKRFVVLGVLAINVLAQLAIALLGAMPGFTPEQIAARPLLAVAGILATAALPAFAVLAFSRRPRVDVALMLFIIATQFFYAWEVLGVDGAQ